MSDQFRFESSQLENQLRSLRPLPTEIEATDILDAAQTRKAEAACKVDLPQQRKSESHAADTDDAIISKRNSRSHLSSLSGFMVATAVLVLATLYLFHVFQAQPLLGPKHEITSSIKNTVKSDQPGKGNRDFQQTPPFNSPRISENQTPDPFEFDNASFQFMPTSLGPGFSDRNWNSRYKTGFATNATYQNDSTRESEPVNQMLPTIQQLRRELGQFSSF